MQMQHIGRYEIEREIGRGSMGVVYLARDPKVRRHVALKTHEIPDGLSPGEEREFRERFLREAEAAGALNHPGIVTIHDAGEDPGGGAAFIAMEYVEGRSLKEILRADGALPVERVLAMADTLAGALEAAHRAGVIHRDIKPANILVRESDDAVKIADFGVARVATSELTRTGDTLGSPAYMAPEQIRGEPVDPRSDLFALAVILYEALCAERPFAGRDVPAIAYAIVHHTPVPISRRRSGLPGGIDAFFEKALAKDPAARFQDGAAFRLGIEALRRTRPGEAVPADAAEPVEATLREAPGPGPRGHARPPWAARILAAAGRLPFSQVRGVLAAAGRLPFRLGRREVLAGGLVVATVIVSWVVLANHAILALEGENRFESAVLTILVDGEPVYTRSLAADRKQVRMFGKDLFEYGKEKFEARVRVRGGEHELVAEVVEDGSSDAYRDRTVVDVASGETLRLKLDAGQGVRGGVSLRVD